MRPTALLSSGATPTPGPTPTGGGAPESVVSGLAFLLAAGTLALAVGAALAGSLLAVGAAAAVELPDRRLAPVLPAVATIAIDTVLSGGVGANLFVLGFESPAVPPFVAIQAPVVAFAGLAMWIRADAG